jgi:oxygen-independent coproporphyrinogen-3 oxidase
MSYKKSYLEALSEEIRLRREYLKGEPVDTVYFGGGTPSLLKAEELELIFDRIDKYFNLSVCREVTLEANPDDISSNYLRALRSLPFNRISMGIQSFDREDLLFLQRRHDREQALRTVALCKEQGYENLSIDLIYGLPGQTADKWKTNLEEALRLDIPHISPYHLIYEEDTALYRLLEEKAVKPLEEEESLTLFSILIDTLAEAGYQHYEISNFARPGYISQHNSSYWLGKKYLGLGPSAHSYNGNSREWNVSSLSGYIQAIRNGTPDMEQELLTASMKYNDYIITRLRTSEVINPRQVGLLFGPDYQTYYLEESLSFLDKGLLAVDGERFYLTRKGLFLSDSIMRALIRLPS